jgi:phosphoglycerol transferase MdoB-like AlkP superfamily enzyme
MPWDIKSGSNVAGLLDSFNILQLKFLTNWIFLLAVAVNITIVVLIFIRQGAMYIKRPVCYIVSVVCIFAAIFILITLPKVGLADSASVYQKDGYVRGFIISAQLWAKTNDTDESGLSDDDQYKFTDKKATTDTKPNVIFIMSEAFWDVTKLPDVTFSEDPIPNLRALSKEGLSGKIPIHMADLQIMLNLKS